MITNGLHHASFPVTDLDRAKRFYGEVLGLVEMARPDFPFEGAWYRAGGCEVHLIVPMDGVDVGQGPAGINPFSLHTAFAIDDYAGVVERLKDLEIEILETSAEMGQLWIRDPDGNVIELITPRQTT